MDASAAILGTTTPPHENVKHNNAFEATAAGLHATRKSKKAGTTAMDPQKPVREELSGAWEDADA